MLYLPRKSCSNNTTRDLTSEGLYSQEKAHGDRGEAKWLVYQISPGNGSSLHLPVLVTPKNKAFWDCPIVSTWDMGSWMANCRSETFMDYQVSFPLGFRVTNTRPLLWLALCWDRLAGISFASSKVRCYFPFGLSQKLTAPSGLSSFIAHSCSRRRDSKPPRPGSFYVALADLKLIR